MIGKSEFGLLSVKLNVKDWWPIKEFCETVTDIGTDEASYQHKSNRCFSFHVRFDSTEWIKY